MTYAAIASKIHQSLDIHGRFTTQITFHGVSANLFANFIDFGFVQLFDLGSWIQPQAITNFRRFSPANPIYRS
jgi:hypothetical protein